MHFLRNRKLLLTLILLGIAYIGLFILFRKFEITSEKISSLVAPFGTYGFIALFALQFIASLTPIPDTALASLGVILYGPLKGTIAVFLGMYLAANIHYYIARKLGREYIVRRFPSVETFTNKYSAKISLKKLILMRIFNLLSFDIVSYFSGVGGVSFKRFTISTAIALAIHVTLNAILASFLIAG